MFALDSSGESLAELASELATLVVARSAIGLRHDRAEVAKIDVVDGGKRGIGPVPPVGGARARPKPFGQLQQLTAPDRCLALLLALLVLLGDRLAHRGKSPGEELLDDRTLFLGKLFEEGLAVYPTRSQALRLGPLDCWHRRRRWSVPPTAVSPLALVVGPRAITLLALATTVPGPSIRVLAARATLTPVHRHGRHGPRDHAS